MRIDSHQHFWKYNATRDRWITEEMAILQRDFFPPELLTEMQSSGIDGSVAVQADQSEEETRFLLRLASEYPRILGVVGWVDLCSERVAERLAFFSQFPAIRGFRHIVQAEADDFMLRTDFVRGLRCLSDFGFTYDILVYARQLPAAVKLVEKFPEQHFVLDHIGKSKINDGVTDCWRRSIQSLAAHPHVYCKVSGLVTEADWKHWRADDFNPYLDVVFETFGTDRLIFGSDWPVCLLAANYRQVKAIIDDYTSRLPQAAKDKIFGLNAIRFYGLTTQG
jgi:L-fuconolactonase